jgi:hypothetical protein
MLSLAIAEWKGKMPAKALMRPVFANRLSNSIPLIVRNPSLI